MLLRFEPEQWFWLVISILVVWRLTTLICYEAGPFGMMIKLRMALYRAKLGNLVDCFHCCSMWVAMAITLSIYKLHYTTIFLWLAIAGGTSVIERFLSNNSNQSNENND